MPKHDCDLIIDARWVLPIAPRNRVLENAAVAIGNGRILALGPQTEVHRAFGAARHERLGQHILMPGLINAHGHAAMSLLRGIAEDTPLSQWLSERVWPLEARLVDADFVRDGTRLAIAEMLRAGITGFSDMYFFPEVVAAEARAAGMRCQVAFPIIRFPNAWSANTDEALHKGLELHDLYRNDPLVQVAFGPHSGYTVDRSDLERILMFSSELDANVHIHLHETAQEVAEAEAATGERWLATLHAIGLLGPRLQAVHATYLDPAEIELLAHTGVQVVHCPHSNLKLASGLCPTVALDRAGVNLALGTDSAASNNSLDLFAEARLASLLAKVGAADAEALPAARMLEIATLGGARALGLDSHLGSLEPGKCADLIAVDVAAPRFQPVHDPMAQLIHCAAGSAVSHVWVDGRAILANDQLTTLDEAALLGAAGHWRERIRGRIHG